MSWSTLSDAATKTVASAPLSTSSKKFVYNLGAWKKLHQEIVMDLHELIFYLDRTLKFEIEDLEKRQKTKACIQN